jgi:hypothetical protein
MNHDDDGAFQITPNGTIFSYDGNNTVIDSTQLTGDEFKAITGCNMVTPGMPYSADLETEECLQKFTTPNSNSSAKRESEVFERSGTVSPCRTVICRNNSPCRATGCVRCLIVFVALPGVCLGIHDLGV